MRSAFIGRRGPACLRTSILALTSCIYQANVPPTAAGAADKGWSRLSRGIPMCRFGGVVRFVSGLSAVVLGLAACGTGSFTVTCADRGLAAVTDFNQRVQLRGFSFLPPSGPHWCVSTFGASDTGVAFAKNQFGGRTLQALPSEEENAHTFVPVAYTAEVDGPRPADALELKSFVEQWLRNSGLSQPQPSGKVLMSTKPATDPEGARFMTIRSEVAVDMSLGAACVRYSSITEEHDNPRAHGGVFVMEAPESYVCLHRTSAREVIVLEYSERYIKGRRPGPPFVETLKPEIEPFLRSVKFDATG